MNVCVLLRCCVFLFSFVCVIVRLLSSFEFANCFCVLFNNMRAHRTSYSLQHKPRLIGGLTGQTNLGAQVDGQTGGPKGSRGGAKGRAESSLLPGKLN